MEVLKMANVTAKSRVRENRQHGSVRGLMVIELTNKGGIKL